MSDPIDFAFLHGGGQGGWIWADVIAALALQTGGDFGRALALDVPGCGAKRDRPTDALTMEDIAAELVGDIERAGLHDVVLVGHSQAGQAIAYMLAARRSLFRRVVYVTCSMPIPGQTVVGMMGSAPRGVNAGEVGWPDLAAIRDPAARARLFTDGMAPAMAGALLARLGRDMWPASTYAETRWPEHFWSGMPATYVVCLADILLPAAWQEVFAERLQVTRRVRLDAGHQPMNTHPQALAEILIHDALHPAASHQP